MSDSHDPRTSDDAAIRPSAGFGYVPALDGLRGVAILLVMVYHAFPTGLHGGFLGVELFFVLSGFLITALLLKEWEKYGSISLPYFYMRRVIRLMPALVLLLCCVTFIGWLIFTGAGPRTPFRDAALSFGYVMNWARAGGWVEQSFVAHTWSLSIEEQFYLLWPVIVLGLCRTCPMGQIGRRLLVMGAIIAMYRSALVIAGASSLRLYNGLDTRADGLVVGSALAALLHAGVIDASSAAVRERFRRYVPWALLGLAATVLLADWRFPLTYTLLLPITVVSSTLLIGGVYLSPKESPLRRCLEGKTLVGLGRISYGLYLWHYPVYRMLGGLGLSPVLTALVGTALSVTLAAMSYRYVERPILRLKGRFSPAAARQRESSAAVPA